jgi:hypothetical protein
MNDNGGKELEQVLLNNFGITLKGGELDTESEYFKQLQRALAQRIEFLINSNVEKLFQILYKIDVPQKFTDDAFELGEIKKISLKIAEHVIARQLQKIDYAKKFYNK